MTPTCPDCGSVRVELTRKTGKCLEADCGLMDVVARFGGGYLNGRRSTPNKRDPIVIGQMGPRGWRGLRSWR